MILLADEWLFWLMLLLVGIGIGFILGLSSNAVNSKNKKLHEKLTESQHRMYNYKKKVSYHFANTASLVNELTESYHKIHSHLAIGARQFGDDPDTDLNIDDAVDPLHVALYTDILDDDDKMFTTEPIDYVPIKEAGFDRNLAQESYNTLYSEAKQDQAGCDRQPRHS